MKIVTLDAHYAMERVLNKIVKDYGSRTRDIKFDEPIVTATLYGGMILRFNANPSDPELVEVVTGEAVIRGHDLKLQRE